MNDTPTTGLITATYYLTPGPDADSPKFVHSASCQVIPDGDRLELGAFDTCAPAMDAARARTAEVNACALCCSACYQGSDAF